MHVVCITMRKIREGRLRHHDEKCLSEWKQWTNFFQGLRLDEKLAKLNAFQAPGSSRIARKLTVSIRDLSSFAEDI